MRAMLFGVAALAVVTLSSPDAVRCALATSASALVEATPFLLAGIFASAFMRRRDLALAHLGCGCAGGASARSLPAAAAAWFVFGPFVAIGRYAAATVVTLALARRPHQRHAQTGTRLHLLAELYAIVPAALMAGASVQILQYFDRLRFTPIENVAAGAALGFVAAPCGIGAVALAGALGVHAPIAARAFLCVAGIVDIRALGLGQSYRRPDHDACAYGLLAIALGIIAWRRGDALVHPSLVCGLWVCALAATCCAVLYRRRRCPAARLAPGLMLAGTLIGAPPPAYHATETTLIDLFAGERLTFNGVLTCDRTDCALVRYAITCCRADAVPVAVRLDRRPRYGPGTWLRADGHVDGIADNLRLDAQRVERIAPPSDPFIYR